MNQYIELALREARYGMKKGRGGPFGAVIVKDGKVLAKDHNRVLKDRDCTCHAEINVIRKACKKLKTFDLSSCDLYTTGEPCKMCMGAIGWAKIKRVYFGNTYKDALNMGFNDDTGNNERIDMIRLDSSETVKLVEEWNSFTKRVLY